MTSVPLLVAGPHVALVPVPPALTAALQAGNATAVAAELTRLGLRAADGWPRPGTPPDAGYLVRLGEEVVGDCGRIDGPDAEGRVRVDAGLVPAARQHTAEVVAVLCPWTQQQPGVRLLVAELPPEEVAVRDVLGALGFVERGSHPPARRLVRSTTGEPLPRIRGRHVC